MIDINQDGLVSLEELQEYLSKKSKDGHFDPNITAEIYGMIDITQDGRVTL